MSVQVLVEWVSKCSWNHCPGVAGMSVQVLSEYAEIGEPNRDGLLVAPLGSQTSPGFN